MLLEPENKENLMLSKQCINISPPPKDTTRKTVEFVDARPTLICDKLQQPLFLGFGCVKVSTVHIRRFNLVNPSDSVVTLTLESTTIPRDKGFAVTIDDQFSIAPHGSKSVDVEWTPDHDMSVRDTLRFLLNEKYKLEVTLHGIAGMGEAKTVPKKTQRPIKSASLIKTRPLQPHRSKRSKPSKSHPSTLDLDDEEVAQSEYLSRSVRRRVDRSMSSMSQLTDITTTMTSISLDANAASKKQAAVLKAWMNHVFDSVLDGDITDSVLEKAKDLYEQHELAHSLQLLAAEISSKRLSIRNEHNLRCNVGLREKFAKLLLSYDASWLALAIQVIFGEKLKLSKEPTKAKAQLKSFINDYILNDEAIQKAYAEALLTPKLENQFAAEIGAHALKYYFTIVIFLDAARSHRILSNTKLFNATAAEKSTKDMIAGICKDFLCSEGDIFRHLQRIHIKPQFIQSYVDEFDFTVTNFAEDLKDGIRLCRLADILLPEETSNLVDALRVPAISRLQKVHNVALVLDALKLRGLPTLVADKQIVDGNMDATISLLRLMMSEYDSAYESSLPSGWDEVTEVSIAAPAKDDEEEKETATKNMPVFVMISRDVASAIISRFMRQTSAKTILAKLRYERDSQEAALKEAAETLAREQAEKEAAEALAKEKAEKEAAETLAREQAEKEAAEALAREQAEALAREQAEKEAAETLAREQAEKEAAETLAKEQAEKEAAETLAREQAEKEAAEALAREQAEKEAAEALAREQAEKEAAETLAREQAEKEAAETLAREQAEKEAAEALAREKAEKEAAMRAAAELKQILEKEAALRAVEEEKLRKEAEAAIHAEQLRRAEAEAIIAAEHAARVAAEESLRLMMEAREAELAQIEAEKKEAEQKRLDELALREVEANAAAAAEKQRLEEEISARLALEEKAKVEAERVRREIEQSIAAEQKRRCEVEALVQTEQLARRAAEESLRHLMEAREADMARIQADKIAAEQERLMEIATREAELQRLATEEKERLEAEAALKAKEAEDLRIEAAKARKATEEAVLAEQKRRLEAEALIAAEQAARIAAEENLRILMETHAAAMKRAEEERVILAARKALKKKFTPVLKTMVASIQAKQEHATRCNAAAVTIQSAYRGIREIHTYHTMRSSIVMIQRAYRVYMNRVIAVKHSQAASLITRVLRKCCFSRRVRAVTIIQRFYRTHLASAVNHKQASATIIQRYLRGYFVYRWYAEVQQQRRVSILKTKHATDVILRFVYNALISRKQLRASQVINRFFRAHFAYLRVKKLARGIRRLQAVFRAHVVRHCRSKDVIKMHQRIKAAEAKAKAHPNMQLGNMTLEALSILQNGKMVSRVLGACQTLELSTHFSKRCCENFVSSNASTILFNLIRSCNRSTPHQELLRCALMVLMNVTGESSRAAAVAKDFDGIDILVDLMQMFRDKRGVFVTACQLLHRLMSASTEIKMECNATEMRKRLDGILHIMERKHRLEERVNTVARGKTAKKKKANEESPIQLIRKFITDLDE